MTDQRVFKIDFNPNRTQKAFIESRSKADLFSSRRGEGKSTALAWANFYHTRHNPGAKWCFVRDTWENLQRTTLSSFFEWFPPGIAGNWHATKKEWTWAEGIATGTVVFMGMDDPADASRLLSLELAGFAIDEPAPAVTSGGVDEMVFDLAMTSLRQSGMKWYAAKLAENNPDESHWTYRKFVSPGTAEFSLWQPATPENVENLPPDYYENMRKTLAHRPDLVRRFVDGEFGFQSQGRAVTPQWSDRLHLSLGLTPIPRVPIYMLWDWGHNPTCLITQISPAGQWLILDAIVGDGIGVEELIENEVRPTWVQRYKTGRHELHHIGDPAGTSGEQTSISRSPVRAVRTSLGGTWRPGPVRIHERVEPARAVLTKTVGGTGLVQVDRHRSAALHYALRGGWHFPVSRVGVIGSNPVKNEHSHPGDAFSYGAAVLFPLGKLARGRIGTGEMVQNPMAFWGGGRGLPPAPRKTQGNLTENDVKPGSWAGPAIP